MYKKEAFVLAESFHQVALDIVPDDWLDNEADDWHWLVPSIVNLAFACEMYLKSLLSDKTDIINGHDLFKLFDMLGEDIQQKILLSKEFRGDDSFFGNLKLNRLVFIEWRYHIEQINNKTYSVNIAFLEKFAKVLNEVTEEEIDNMERNKK